MLFEIASRTVIRSSTGSCLIVLISSSCVMAALLSRMYRRANVMFSQRWEMVSDFLGRQTFRQRIQNHRDIDPRSLNTRLPSAYIRPNNDALQESSVSCISHCALFYSIQLSSSRGACKKLHRLIDFILFSCIVTSKLNIEHCASAVMSLVGALQSQPMAASEI